MFSATVYIAIADWTLFYIFNRNGLSRRIFVRVLTLIIIPLTGFLINLALFLLLVLGVFYDYLSTIIVHGGLLQDGRTGFTEISKEMKAICDDKLLIISIAYVGVNFCCLFDAINTRLLAVLNELLRPHPRAQG